MSTALILGGGAPNATLMSGALYAFEEKGVKFNVISTSGAGALIGLLYVSPKGQTPGEALKNTIQYGISNPIYDSLPVNYKVFQKPGMLADLYRKFLQTIPSPKPFVSEILDESTQRLFFDWWQLMLSTACPTSLNYSSKGLCANVPFIEDIVDFSKIKQIKPYFYINAYNITDQRMENFPKEDITPDHFRAAMSFPYIYPPYKIDGKAYFEGATVDALNYKSLIANHPEVKTIVVFDILGSDSLIREPRNLYDAWVMSIIVPLVEIARDDTKIFELKYNTGKNKRRLLKVKFAIPDDYWPYVLDWSYSNLEKLFEIGYKSGLQLYEQHKNILS